MSDASTTETWKTWFAQNGAKLLLFARQQTRTESDAEDVLQTAILKTWDRESKVPPDLPLVFVAIRRSAIDLGRSNDRRSRREQDAAPPGELWFDPDPIQTETHRLLETEVKKLPAKYQEVITLKIWGELTFAQIATTLDIPLNTAASRYRYALTQLKSQLAPILT